MQAAVTLAENGEAIVLVDSGWPRTRSRLLESLRQRGLQPEQVTHILHTHMHIDHAANHSLFPRARLLVSAFEFQWADRFYRLLVDTSDDVEFLRLTFPDLAPEEILRAMKLAQLARKICRQDFFERWNEFQFYDETSLPAGIEAVSLPGHTPGHAGISIQTSPPTLVAGDALAPADASLTEMPPVDISQYQTSAAKVRDFRGLIIPGHFRPFYQ